MNAKQIPLRPGGLELTEIVASEASLTKDSCVLDIGCGMGASLLYIWKHYGCHVFGVDCSEKAIEAAKASFTEAADPVIDEPCLVTADASSLPFPNHSFDLVMMECTLTLFSDPIRALEEATRVLKPGGTLFISALTQRKMLTEISEFDHSQTQPTGSNNTNPTLITDGLLLAGPVCHYLSTHEFHHISCTERNDVLVQFVADAIFTYGSLDNYIKEASACIDGCVLNCTISPKEAGYAYILANKI